MAAKIGKNKSHKITSKSVKKTSKINKPKKAGKLSVKLKKSTKLTNVKPKASVKIKQKSKAKSKSSVKSSSKTLVKSSVKSNKTNKTNKVKPIYKVEKLKKRSNQHSSIKKNSPKIQQDENINFTFLENNDFYQPQHSFESLETNDLDGPSKFQPYHINISEEYMNEQQLQHFANILENWKQDLMEEVDNTITEMKEADVLADPNDRATQEETFSLELRTRDRERKLIKKIESALNKIDEQQYGYCDSCAVEIGIRRLEARPTATLCIECKTLAEIKEKRS